jgi:hypothetical protein
MTDSQVDRDRETLILQDTFDELERIIANLEKENRKLNDRLNRFRNLTPGRKRLYSLGRIASFAEADADMAFEDPNERPIIDGEAARADALYLHRLQWDLEQLREVVYPSDVPSHEWRRP